MARSLAVLGLVHSLLLPVAQVVVPTNSATTGPRTGMIVGQVVDATTGAPIAEAIVQLAMPKNSSNPASPRGRVMADGDGRFFFTDLPAGEYYLNATKAGYAPGVYGQRQALGQTQLLSLGEGERAADVKLRVWKYGVIAGTVVDEAGEPVVGVGVRTLMKNVIAGRAQFGNPDLSGDLMSPATTDDRGMFRLSQLTPGTYIVVVPSTQITLPAAYLEGQDPALRGELFMSGVTEIASPGQPRTQQAGDVALLTPSRALIPPQPTAAGRMAVYRTTYYPAATTAAAATQVAINAGEERTDIAIALRPERASRVSGRLVAADGSMPPPTTIRLVGEAMTDIVTYDLPDGVGFEAVSGMSDAAGRFTLLGVPPGEYVLRHAARFLSRALQQGKTAYWIAQPVTVGADDLSDLTVQLRPALRVEGRVEFRGTNPLSPVPPPPIAGLVFETPFGEPGRFAVETTRGATVSFSTVAAGGRYIVRPYELGGWFVRSITVPGRDITDRVFDLQADTTSIVVTYTDRPSKVSGTVTDARGAASPTAVVLAFPVDPKMWSGYGWSPRTLKSALTTKTGAYTFDHLPPGDYNVIAVAPADADGWQDPARLEALAAEAAKLTVAAGDALKTLDLRLKAIR